MSSSTSSSDPAPRRWGARLRLSAYGVVLGLFIVAALPVPDALRDHLGIWFLTSVGELWPVETIVDRQLDRQALYGSAIYDDNIEYKHELIRQRRPEVLVLGSSRALQFREEFFSVPFANAGRGMNDIGEGHRFLDVMLAIHRPRMVLLTIDFWWLNPNRVYRSPKRRDLSDPADAVSAYWSYINDRKLTYGQVVWSLLGDDTNPISEARTIGIAAYTRGRGYRPDGSRDYGARYFGLDPAFDDALFENSIRRVEEGIRPLSHGGAIDHQRLATLEELIRRLQQDDIHVVAVLPPFAHAVLQAIDARGADYAYIPLARDALSRLAVDLFDFTDPSALGAGDCEFADGLHGGDVVYQRMLLRMVERGAIDPDLVRTEALTANIATFEGHAVSELDGHRYRHDEVDFLRIGCRK